MSLTDIDKAILPEIINIAEDAGRSILRIYSLSDFGIVMKINDSPLTLADTAAHEAIVRSLNRLTPDWPVLSEESKSVPYNIRKEWKTFWMVDPLDGTKEFIKRNGEFTVNIALIKGNVPVMGVVHAPVKQLTYFAEDRQGAFKSIAGAKAERIQTDKKPKGVLKVVISRDHIGGEMEAFLKTLEHYEAVHVGSSLKFCLVAEGQAHLYPRFWPCMEWDTAAAECVVREAGGSVKDLSGNNLKYNKPDLLNPYFIVKA